MNRVFFTSDTHFGHKNIIRYCNRPFDDVKSMNNEMIDRWNSVVGKNDTVYHLGDFAFATPEEISEIISKLNGFITLVYGNHDKTIKKSKDLQKQFNIVRDYYEISINDDSLTTGSQKIVLCHYPMVVWNKSHYGSWMLHGHCHGTLNYPFVGKILDVGSDVHNLTPISYEQIKLIMKDKQTASLDHH